MSNVPVELHDSSLRLIRIVLCFVLVVHPRPHWKLKLLHNVAHLVYLLVVSRWRFAFDYEVNYDHVRDNFSRLIDLVNFVVLIVGHGIVSMELLWRNGSEQIEQQLLQIHNVLRETFGRKLNHRHFRLYSNIIFSLLLARVIISLASTIYYNVNAKSGILLSSVFYSEVVLKSRCTEFTLHSAVILEIYQELHETAKSLLQELESSRFKNWSHLQFQRLATIQQLHQQLWKTQRDIERNFGHSLIMVLLKYFIDTSILPYWAYVNRINVDDAPLRPWCVAEEIGKLLEICIMCWFCTRCDQLQRRFRSLFHGIYVDRHNEQLNTALLRLSAQLGQEICQFRIDGLLTINNAMLAKFLIGMLTYTIINIQFRITYTVKLLGGGAELNVSLVQ